MGRGALVQSKGGGGGGGLLSYIGGGFGQGGAFALPRKTRGGGFCQGGAFVRGAYVLHSGGIKLASQFLWTRKNAHVLKWKENRYYKA